MTANLRWASPVTIVQDATSITVSYTSGGRSHARIKRFYWLDGKVSQNVDGASVAPQERQSTAEWSGASLILIDLVDWPDRTSGTMTPHEYREILTLESPTLLRLESSRTVRGRSAKVVARFRRGG